MKKELGSVTTIVIAHRLTTVKNADNIIVLKKGRIIEQGTHNSLKDAGNLYAKLAADQDKTDEKEAQKEAERAAAEDELKAAGVNADLLAIAAKATDRRASVKVKALDAKAIHETDPKAKAKLIEAEKTRLDKEAAILEDMDDLVNPKKAERTYGLIMATYTRPQWSSIAGVALAGVVGIVAPMYGWFIMEAMNQMNFAAFGGNDVMDATLPWCGAMLLGSIVLFIAKGGSGIFLARVAENVIEGVRTDLYNSIVRKNIGWHDDRMNSAGVMTATLASDVQLLNGVSAEGKAASTEGMVALIVGIVAAFIWSWPMALVGIGVAPFIMIAGAITAKADMESIG